MIKNYNDDSNIVGQKTLGKGQDFLVPISFEDMQTAIDSSNRFLKSIVKYRVKQNEADRLKADQARYGYDAVQKAQEESEQLRADLEAMAADAREEIEAAKASFMEKSISYIVPNASDMEKYSSVISLLQSGILTRDYELERLAKEYKDVSVIRKMIAKAAHENGVEGLAFYDNYDAVKNFGDSFFEMALDTTYSFEAHSYSRMMINNFMGALERMFADRGLTDQIYDVREKLTFEPMNIEGMQKVELELSSITEFIPYNG